jgi:hypothetical protein
MGLRDSYRQWSPSNGAPSELEQLIRRRWPNVADALFGVSNAEDAANSLPSCSIIMFVEGDRLKFCLTPQGKEQVAFGTISRPTDGFDGLEAALAAGDFAWRSKKGKR